MDTSETYIKMLRSAWPDLKDNVPIQAMLFSRRQRMLYVLDNKIVTYREHRNTSNVDRAIPLLEQDQLQEMVGLWVNNRFGVAKILNKFQYFWRKNLSSDLVWNLHSMEQLWLAFVMKEKYSKTWDGEKWEDHLKTQ